MPTPLAPSTIDNGCPECGCAQEGQRPCAQCGSAAPENTGTSPRIRRWQRGERALCSCRQAPEECLVTSGTGRRKSRRLPGVQRRGEEPHYCATAVLVDGRGRPGKLSSTLRLSRVVIQKAEEAAKKEGISVRAWIEGMVLKSSTVEPLRNNPKPLSQKHCAPEGEGLDWGMSKPSTIPTILVNGAPVRRLICTRHSEFQRLLLDADPTLVGVPVLEHAGADDVRGAHIFGQVPLHVAVYAAAQTLIPLDLPRELRGVELSIEQLRQYAGAPQTYRIVTAARAASDAYEEAYWRTACQEAGISDPLTSAPVVSAFSIISQGP